MGKALAHSGTGVEQSKFVGGGMFDVAHASGETFEYAVVVEDEFAIECLADVDLNDVAAHPCGQCDLARGA